MHAANGCEVSFRRTHDHDEAVFKLMSLCIRVRARAIETYPSLQAVSPANSTSEPESQPRRRVFKLIVPFRPTSCTSHVLRRKLHSGDVSRWQAPEG